LAATKTRAKKNSGVMSMNTAPASLARVRSRLSFPLGLLALNLIALGSIGCATENKIVKTSRYSLAYPDFWKVDKVAANDGEATKLTIGRYSTGVINEGSGAGDLYESSQADVDVRIYSWPETATLPEPTKKVSELLFSDPDLQMSKQAQIADGSHECGKDFKAKFTILKNDQYPMDLFSKPGFRSILIGGTSGGVLIGVSARVPYEQDNGLYCHNLSNMRTQLQTVLDGLTLNAPAAAAPAAPAGDAPKP
jgi:hypothetical protein